MEHAQRVDRIINKKEYEKEIFLRAQLNLVVEEAEAVFQALEGTDISNPKALKLAQRDVKKAMDACVTNFERFMALIQMDEKKNPELAQSSISNQ
jgi:hypothetical protein